MGWPAVVSFLLIDTIFCAEAAVDVLSMILGARCKNIIEWLVMGVLKRYEVFTRSVFHAELISELTAAGAILHEI